jgi:hypothetical protein
MWRAFLCLKILARSFFMPHSFFKIVKNPEVREFVKLSVMFGGLTALGGGGFVQLFKSEVPQLPPAEDPVAQTGAPLLGKRI